MAVNGMIRLCLFICAILIIGGSTGGCWDKKEAEDLGYVRSTALDSAPGGKVRLLVQIPNPATFLGGGLAAITPGTSQDAKAYRNFEVEGDTVFEAIRRMSLQSPRRLFFAQNTTVIFSEALARQGIAPHFDFFERSVEIRRRLNYFFITPNDPRVLLDVPAPHENTPAGRIERIILQEQLTSRFAAVTLSAFIRMLAAEGQDAFCGVARVRNNPARPGLVQQTNAPEPALTIELSGAAAFRGDRFAGYLNERETRGVLWARNELQGGFITVASPSGNGHVTFSISRRAKSRIIPAIEDGRLMATVKIINVVAELAQSEPQLDLTRSEVMRSLDQALAREIEREVIAAAHRSQDLGADVLGVGASFHRMLPGEWREMRDNWPEIFPTVEITAQVEATVRRTGFIQKAITIND
ncbi:MAG: Ger(x)C family spore germination protein [Candidatus Desulforudis sp.]|nr:Ger(x)C family spore germination protein [Desulforudis sp.]